MSEKLENNKYYDPNVSLTEISTYSYTTASCEFGNIYSRGAFIISLLDIKLLELSNGKTGVRELVLKLIETYGVDNAFYEKDFFDLLVKITYPEIRNFLDVYIKGTKPLPVAEYYAKIGIDYNESENKFTKITFPSTSQSSLFDA